MTLRLHATPLCSAVSYFCSRIASHVILPPSFLLTGTFVNFPGKCKNRLYKSIVRFMSTMFILQAANNKRTR